ncbi:hypothetical protein CWATWH8502_1692 [Crocosphaera watsonii WH 8502]|uniref:Uncharacterized protein n=1 Tax=Crocosphaera watsonii WH 8502 TaxID=423474 RepID=T2IKC8_CROWT|nr:hypothetical protein CWATWH8502_1692 [Crocosphaera watsonii WH 8502]
MGFVSGNSKNSPNVKVLDDICTMPTYFLEVLGFFLNFTLNGL